MTTATGSPTWRAASLLSGMCGTIGQVLHHAGNLLLLAQVPAAGQRVHARHVRAGEHGHHARMLLGRGGVDLSDAAEACGLRTNAAQVAPGSFTSST
jgi:hypothetical protein